MARASDFVWNIVPKVTQYGSSVITTIILARLLSPDDYGLIALANAFYILVNVFVWDGLGNGLVQKNNPDEIDYSSVFFFNFGFSLVIYTVFYLTIPYISLFCGYGILLTEVLRFISVRIIFSAVISIQNAYISKNLLFSKKVVPSFLSSSVSGVMGIVLAIYGLNVWALAVQYVIASAIEMLALYYMLPMFIQLRFSWRRVVPILDYSWKVLVESIVSNATVQIRSLLIGKEYSSTELGLYSKGQQLPAMISNCFCVPLHATVFPLVSSLNSHSDEAKKLVRKVISIAGYILFPLFFFIACSASEWVVILLTEKWSEMIPFVYIFCLTYLFDIGIFTKNAALMGTGDSTSFMRVNSVVKILDIIIMAFCIPYGIWAIAISTSITGFLLYMAVSCNVKDILSYSLKEQAKDVLPVTLLCMISSVACVCWKYNVDNLVIIFCFKAIVFVFVYVLMSAITRNSSFVIILDYIRGWQSKGKSVNI